MVPTINILEMAVLDKEEFEVKVHFEMKQQRYFGILNLKNGAFISNLVDIDDSECQAIIHHIGHQAEHFMEEQGISLPPEIKCGCKT